MESKLQTIYYYYYTVADHFRVSKAECDRFGYIYIYKYHLKQNKKTIRIGSCSRPKKFESKSYFKKQEKLIFSEYENSQEKIPSDYQKGFALQFCLKINRLFNTQNTTTLKKNWLTEPTCLVPQTV